MGVVMIADGSATSRGRLMRQFIDGGFDCIEIGRGTEVTEKLQNDSVVDIVVIDCDALEPDGFTLCRAIRKVSQVPVILISERQSEHDRICAFEIGADDYVIKPYYASEVVMRAGAVMRRVKKSKNSDEVIDFGRLKVDSNSHNIEVDGEIRELKPKEFELLKYFISNRNVVMTHAQIITEVWNYEFTGDERILYSYVKMLRKSLGSCGDMIKTIRGVGYRFDG